MNRVLQCIVLAAGLISFVGCQRDFTFGDTPVVPVIPPGDSTGNVLVKYYQLDSTSASQIDTGIFTHFFYDNSKRLIAIIGTTSSDTAINNNFYEQDNFYYLNNDTLPYKLIVYSTLGGSPMGIDTTFYTYNATGKITRDSSIYSSSSTEVTTYQYAGNAVTVTRQGNDVDSVTQVFQNGNLVSQHSVNYQNGTAGSVSDFTYTFDSHINPFYLPALYGTKAVGD